MSSYISCCLTKLSSCNKCKQSNKATTHKLILAGKDYDFSEGSREVLGTVSLALARRGTLKDKHRIDQFSMLWDKK